MIIVSYILMLIGAFFYAIGGLGIYRMPDLFNRAQAGTKATTLGTLSLLLGVGVQQPSWIPKLLLIAVFIAVTNPVGSSTLARAGYHSGVPIYEGTQVDDLKELYKKEDGLDE
ncbi:MAG: cation:proton antiporter [delta proteobacterium ML8_F1]|nr:MAG: cation:proton antiporter [delta proteobacterium ML8_F1]